VTSRPHEHSHNHDAVHRDNEDNQERGQANSSTSTRSLDNEISRLLIFLSAHFGPIAPPLTTEQPGKEDDLLVIDISVDGIVARVDLMTMVVTCSNVGLRKRVVGVLEMARSTMTSLARGFVSAGVPLKRKAEEDETEVVAKESKVEAD
jgi:cleavage and polyadenylation specificity factor subunit 3